MGCKTKQCLVHSVFVALHFIEFVLFVSSCVLATQAALNKMCICPVVYIRRALIVVGMPSCCVPADLTVDSDIDGAPVTRLHQPLLLSPKLMSDPPATHAQRLLLIIALCFANRLQVISH